MFVAEKYEKFNMAAGNAENVGDVSVDFSIFQL